MKEEYTIFEYCRPEDPKDGVNIHCNFIDDDGIVDYAISDDSRPIAIIPRRIIKNKRFIEYKEWLRAKQPTYEEARIRGYLVITGILLGELIANTTE